MYSIDLNSDMGESFGAYKIGGDEEIIKYVTTANVACGMQEIRWLWTRLSAWLKREVLW